MNLPSEEIQRLLREVIDHFDKEDTSVRERQIRTYKQLKLLWEGFSRTWYSEVAHDWRIYDAFQGSDADDGQQNYYDKPVNVFRAYLESIIAALSISVPSVKCFPDDAENTLDLSTARAGDKISQLIYRHNKVNLLWLHALYIYCTEGLVACYSYPKADESYGTYPERKYEDSSEEHIYSKCPTCGYQFDDQPLTPELMALMDKAKLSQDKYNPDNQDVAVQNIVQNQELCPQCIMAVEPQLTQETLIVTRLVGVTNQPKSRICLECYGGLYVKVPNYARTQEDCPYLIYEYETHYANVVERYSHLHGKLNQKEFNQKLKASAGPMNPYEEFARLSPQYQGEYPMNVITCKNSWLRPAAFNILSDEDDVKKLKALYPNGVKVVLANDCFAEAYNEALDDCWTLTKNPLSDYIHHDPAGLLLVSIQEITNDLISLVLQTIEHGIGQTFADPGVLNFNAYRQMSTLPGGIYEAIPKSGRSISDAFHELRTATLSPEVMPFANNIQSLGQLVSGALPSLFGGALEGSETASQYSMSRAQALQRQQNTWKMFIVWWEEIFGKVIPMFIKETKDDERDVQRDKDGNFINTFIRKADLEGKIGRIELEASENLPLTWSQQKDVIEKLLLAGNPEILRIIGAPENLPIIRESLGLSQFYVPGEDDVVKQYDEIKLLLNSEPIMNPETGQEMPSVEVDPIFDNNQIEFEIVRKWVISEAGRQAKMDNPAGYKNVLLHGQMHHMIIQQQMMAQQQSGSETTNDKEVTEQDQEAPIMEDTDVAMA